MKNIIGIIDYGAGNFASVWNAFQQHKCHVIQIQHPEQLRKCSHLVLPGVGAFSTAVDRLHGMQLFDPIKEILEEGTRPFLWLCVGMQILSSSGTEFHYVSGFNLVSGAVDRFDFTGKENKFRLPHIGWNDVKIKPDSRLFKGIDPEESNFYFVHSYHLISNDDNAHFSYCNYGYDFIAAFEKGLVFGVQFHPEKSQENGNILLGNFLQALNA